MGSSRCKYDNTIAHLPPDLLCQVLIRFPVKILLQFKSVCKSWLSFIESFDFAKQHCRNHDEHHHIVMHGFDDYTSNFLDSFRYYALDSLKFSFLSDHSSISLGLDLSLLGFPSEIWFDIVEMVSFDGIICISYHHISTFDIRTGRPMPAMQICLWNPTTRNVRLLPQPAIAIPVPGDPCMYDMNISVGLGFDNKSNDYKIVEIVVSPCFKSLAAVYNLRTHSWGTLDVDLPVEGVVSSITEPLRNGKLFCWCVRKARENNLAGFERLILWFDFCNEEFGTIPFPDKIRCHPHIELYVVKDNVASIINLENGMFEFWIMNEFGNKDSWTNLYRTMRLWDRMVSPLNDSESFLVVSGNALCIYNIITLKKQTLPLIGDLSAKLMIKHVRYKESLVPIERAN